MRSRFCWSTSSLNKGIFTFELTFIVQSHIRVLFFDVLKSLILPRDAELHSDIIQLFMKAVGDILSCKIIPLDCVGKGIALIYGYCAGDSFS